MRLRQQQALSCVKLVGLIGLVDGGLHKHEDVQIVKECLQEKRCPAREVPIISKLDDRHAVEIVLYSIGELFNKAEMRFSKPLEPQGGGMESTSARSPRW